MRLLLVILAAIMLASCATTYQINADPNTGKITSLNVSSRREFENGLLVEYDKESGNFKFAAGKVSDGSSALEDAAAALLLQMPLLLAKPVP
jgi:hypothetical protein